MRELRITEHISPDGVIHHSATERAAAGRPRTQFKGASDITTYRSTPVAALDVDAAHKWWPLK